MRNNFAKIFRQQRNTAIAAGILCSLIIITESSFSAEPKNHKKSADISTANKTAINEQTPTVAKPKTETSTKPLQASVSIIIDDIGDRLKDGLRAISLPAPYTYSFLPNTPFAKRLALDAGKMNKEVMLHLPMEAQNGKRLGPNGLTASMTREIFDQTLRNAFKSIPNIQGINNHMGSLLSANTLKMRWLMSFVSEHNTPINNLYFIDSRTTSHSVLVKVAKEQNINILTRDSFIDIDKSEKAILQQIQYLIKIAKKRGIAIGIAHPYPETLAVLETAWPIFYEAGVNLIPVSELIKLKMALTKSKWQLSSSH